MSCGFEEEVSALFDGELPEGDAARVRAHVASCASCRELLGDFESVRAQVRSLRVTTSWWRRRVSIPLPLAAALALLVVAAPFAAYRRAGPPRVAAPQTVVRRAGSGLLAQYDGGGRARITVRPKAQAR